MISAIRTHVRQAILVAPSAPTSTPGVGDLLDVAGVGINGPAFAQPRQGPDGLHCGLLQRRAHVDHLVIGVGRVRYTGGALLSPARDTCACARGWL